PQLTARLDPALIIRDMRKFSMACSGEFHEPLLPPAAALAPLVLCQRLRYNMYLLYALMPHVLQLAEIPYQATYIFLLAQKKFSIASNSHSPLDIARFSH